MTAAEIRVSWASGNYFWRCVCSPWILYVAK